MSVEKRTAASRRVRAFRLANWLLILPAITFFSCSVARGAIGSNGKPDYAGTLREAKSLDVRSELERVPATVVQISRKLSRPFDPQRS
jgi:hypothetical protein